MSNNDTNIEKRSFEAFVNAIGSEIEQAQVRLISAANLCKPVSNIAQWNRKRPIS